eukprot:1247022-Rhodomonas_salina.1
MSVFPSSEINTHTHNTQSPSSVGICTCDAQLTCAMRNTHLESETSVQVGALLGRQQHAAAHAKRKVHQVDFAERETMDARDVRCIRDMWSVRCAV